MTHICVSKLTIICSDNGLSPGRRQAIIWTNAGILLIGTLRTNFNESLIEYHSFSFKKMHMKNAVWKMAAILPRPQCVKAEWNDYFSREVVAMTIEAIPVLAVVVIFDSLCVSSPWWRHQMEIFSASWTGHLCGENSPHKGQWRGALMSSLICDWMNDWVNNREAGDLRRHRGHDNVIMHQLALSTHLPLVPHICVSDSGQRWFKWWLVVYSAPTHYLKQCWVIVNWTLRKKNPWIFSQNTKFFIHKKIIWKYRLRKGGHFVQGSELKQWGKRGYIPIHVCQYLGHASNASVAKGAARALTPVD